MFIQLAQSELGCLLVADNTGCPEHMGTTELAHTQDVTDQATDLQVVLIELATGTSSGRSRRQPCGST